MQIRITTGHTIEGREVISAHLRSIVGNALRHLAPHVTRVDFYVADENGSQTTGNNQRCMMEAQLEGRPPAAVTHHAATVPDAVTGAAVKLARIIDLSLGRLRDGKRHHLPPILPEPEIAGKP